MKKFFLAGIAAVALYSAPAAAISPPYNWTGCYIGGSAGGMWGKTQADYGADFIIETKPNGFIGGGQFGCDYQTQSNWVFGAQGEFNGANAARDTGTVPLPPPFSSETFNTKVEWFASATARLGYAAGPWLIYGKGGAAWVRDKLHDVGNFFIISSFDFSGNVTRSGWTAGGGLEYAFAPNWSAFVEYDFYGFGAKSATLSGVFIPAPGATNETFSLKQDFSVVKVGINYRFATGPRM